ncbi:MAG: hypothetical protein QG621_674, partial [Patescibacteria group bacterium]|nr:hypothetical protein [Patescibacteria group bacterium]
MSWVIVCILGITILLLAAGAYFKALPPVTNSMVNTASTPTSSTFVEVKGNTVTLIPFDLTFDVPHDWSISDINSGMAPSIYNASEQTPFTSLEVRNAKGEYVASLHCPPKPTGMEQLGEAYDSVASSSRSYVKNGVEFKASYEYLYDYGETHHLDTPSFFVAWVGSNKPLV